MKRVIVIQARMGSTRLPGKVLAEVSGRPLLEIQLDRVKQCRLADEVVIATTGNPSDDPVAAFARSMGIPCYRGSERDVLDRYYRAALMAGADVVVRLTGDCPLIDPELIDSMLERFEASGGRLEFLGNTVPLPGTYPDGMDVEVMSFNALARSWLTASKPSEREHVTFHIWKNPELFKVGRFDAPHDWSSYRFTVDYPEDLELLGAIISLLEERGLKGTVQELVGLMDDNPGLKEINSSHEFGEGWSPSMAKDEEMGSGSLEFPAEFPAALPAPPLAKEKGEAIWPSMLKSIPGGSQTFSKGPLQYVEGVAPKVLARGSGCRVWDLDGNEYIDHALGLGPIILGHANEEVNRAAYECASDMFCSPSLPHPLELELAQTIIRHVPCADMVRFGKNGSDATAGAVRLARGITGRDIIGCCGYHGWQDWFIGSTNFSKGVPEAVRKLVDTFAYNDLSSVEELFRKHKGNMAALILEPVNFFPPEDDFLHKLRDICDSNGTLLIFDEIITGFRMDMGGAQAKFGVIPDLASFGKAVANGYPLSMVCGKEKYMHGFEDVFYSFTFGGELPSIAAALKTLEILERDNVLQHIEKMGGIFIGGFNTIASSLKMEYAWSSGYGWWPMYKFTEKAGYSPAELLTLMQQELVKRGVLTRPAPFISFAHKEPDIREVLVAVKGSLSVVAEAVNENKVRDWIEGTIIQPVIREKDK